MHRIFRAIVKRRVYVSAGRQLCVQTDAALPINGGSAYEAGKRMRVIRRPARVGWKVKEITDKVWTQKNSTVLWRLSEEHLTHDKGLDRFSPEARQRLPRSLSCWRWRAISGAGGPLAIERGTDARTRPVTLARGMSAQPMHALPRDSPPARHNNLPSM